MILTESTEQPTLNLADALRDRFEADAILGARSLPIRAPQRESGSVSAPRQAEPGASTHQAQTAGVAPSRGASPPARPATARAAAGEFPNAGHGLQTQISSIELEERRVSLNIIDTKEVQPCTKCGLHETRNKTVFGVGSPVARIMFVGEGPGADEDASGIPFVGRAGELLTKMIESGMGLKRDEVYICNVVKCRPPNNRTPAPDEIVMCKDYLLRQIDLIKPEVIIALGGPAAQTLLNTRDGITRIRGTWHNFYPSGTSLIGEPIPLMPTFHPAYLLRSPAEKSKAWSDLKSVMAKLGLAIPTR